MTRRVFRLLSAAGTGCGGLRVQLHSGYGCDMIDLELRSELLAMKSEDEELHTELSNAGALTGHYVPSLQAVHERNAARLREIVLEHGWPSEERVGPDGAYAAWLIVQHGIGDPSLQRGVLPLLRRKLRKAACLHGRRPSYQIVSQCTNSAASSTARSGSMIHGMDVLRPWPIEEPDKVDSLRASVGLGPLRSIPERGPDLPVDEQESRRENQRWWQDWLASRGWLSDAPPKAE